MCGSFTHHLLIGGIPAGARAALLPKAQEQVTLIFQAGHSLFKRRVADILKEHWYISGSCCQGHQPLPALQCHDGILHLPASDLLQTDVIRHIPSPAGAFPPGRHRHHHSQLGYTSACQYSFTKVVFSTGGRHFLRL